MTLRLAGAVAALGIAVSVNAAENYTIDVRHTFPVFEVKHLGFSTQRGRFNNTSGKVQLDRTAKKGSIEVTIQTASIDMGIDKWDEHMKSEDFFNVAKYPTMNFKSNKINFNDDTPVSAEGELTLLGVSKPVMLSIANFRCGQHPMTKREMCGADVSTSIKRSNWGMKYGAPLVIADEVKLLIPVEAFRE